MVHSSLWDNRKTVSQQVAYWSRTMGVRHVFTLALIGWNFCCYFSSSQKSKRKLQKKRFFTLPKVYEDESVSFGLHVRKSCLAGFFNASSPPSRKEKKIKFQISIFFFWNCQKSAELVHIFYSNDKSSTVWGQADKKICVP